MRKWVLVLMLLTLLVIMVTAKEGVYAFMGMVGTEGQSNAYVLDVTDPTNPIVLFQSSEMDVPDVTIIGDYAYFGTTYVMDFYEYADLVVVDISDIKKPEKVGYLRDDQGQFLRMVTRDNYAFTAGYISGLHILDLSEPSKPSIIKTMKFDDFNGDDGVRDVLINGNYLYLSGATITPEMYYTGANRMGIYVADISDPENPEIVGFVYTGLYGVIQFRIRENYLYCCSEGKGIDIFDISNPRAPAHVRTVYYTNAGPECIAFHGRYAYVADFMDKGILIFDATNPTDLRLLNLVATQSKMGFAVDILDGMLYVADGPSGLLIYSLENPEMPQFVGQFSIEAGLAFTVKVIKR
ncbi:hypothetical protein [Mesotoga prima]|uniref:LVIVD repeat-containing protein n=1 Tax=Mesotoga prima TaxID=1184387 RepID=UPI002C359697|nr:hypothetical protein [Mesotoga prima]HPJ33096.1 hypothetical protein [Mesotoga prima]